MASIVARFIARYGLKALRAIEASFAPASNTGAMSAAEAAASLMKNGVSVGGMVAAGGALGKAISDQGVASGPQNVYNPYETDPDVVYYGDPQGGYDPVDRPVIDETPIIDYAPQTPSGVRTLIGNVVPEEQSIGGLGPVENDSAGSLNYNPYLTGNMNYGSGTMVHARQVTSRWVRRKFKKYKNIKKNKNKVYISC